MRLGDRRLLTGDGLRFVAAGALNTLLTLAIYQLLLFAMPDGAAYALSWMAGLVFVVIVYPDRVFAGGRRDAGARARLGLTYGTLFILGLAVLRGLGAAGISPRLSILAVLVLTTGANFVLSRLILRGA